MLSLAGHAWTFVASDQATPDGELRFGIYERPTSGAFTPEDSTWNTPQDPVAKQFVDASARWQQEVAAGMPEGWSVTGPFSWGAGHYAYAKKNSQQPYVVPAGELQIPDSDAPDRWRIWLPTLLVDVALVIGCWWARRMMKVVITTGPFDPRVYKLLRRIALLAIIAGLGISFWETSLLNNYYAQLDLARFGVYAERNDGFDFNFAWLAALGVVEILRYGVALKQENDVTV
jgi:hypothetical protein